MNCPVGQRKFVDYHQGKLSFEDYKKLNMHLATCDTCARKLDEIMNEGSAKRKSPTVFLSRRKPKFIFAFLSVVLLLLLVIFISRVGWFDDHQVGFGKAVNLSTVDNNIEFTITHVAADEEETILFFEIKDLNNKHNFYTDYNSFIVDENMLGAYTRGNIIQIEIEENGVSKGKLHLLPLLTEEETVTIEMSEVFRNNNLEIEPYSMEWFDEKNRSVVEGNWKLDVPVKKDQFITFDLNETMEVNGKTVEFTEMVVSPTGTTLTYQYQRDQSNQNNFFIRLSHLEVNKNFLPIHYYQSTSSDHLFSETVYTDSIYYDLPKDLTIHFGKMTQRVANQVKIDFQLDQLPYTFQYIGEDITIEEVEVGNPTTIVVKEKFNENRSYNALNIDSTYFRFSGSQLHEIVGSVRGVWLDEDGNEVDQPMSIEETSSLRNFTTEQHFTVFPADDGTLFEPTFLYLEGYSIETNLKESLKISLN